LREAARLKCLVSGTCKQEFWHKADYITVLLQAMKEDPPPDAKCRDKFLVQTVQIPAGQEINNAQALVSRFFAD
jgi:hypothetical protein